MTDEQITLAAREICAAQAQKQDNDDGTRYLVGYYDHTVWMRLVEQGIRRGLEGQAMIKTQHCPNCESIEQKLHDFRQEVSDIVEAYVNTSGKNGGIDKWVKLKSLILAKPDPLVEVLLDMELSHDQEQGQHDARYLRAKLEARGLEIREKGQ
jgi:hypothetical protein